MKPTASILGAIALLAVLALAACAPIPAATTSAPTAAPAPTAVIEQATAAPEATKAVEQALPAETQSASMANPASQNCVAQGGTLKIETRGDGGQCGVCYFEDNRQCEEWALMRGECPVGGLKVTGYVTDAARYCAITGGKYAVTGNSNTDNETGTCTLVGGTVCDATDYYNGKCDATSGAQVPEATQPVTTTVTLVPLSAEECNGLAQSLMEALTRASTNHEIIPATQSTVAMTDPTTMATGTGCRAEAEGTGEQFTGPDVIINSLTDVMTKDGGWKEDIQLQAGGPMGMGTGYRLNDSVCEAAAMWRPADSANCPQDAPISECKLTSAQKLYTITMDCAQETK